MDNPCPEEQPIDWKCVFVSQVILIGWGTNRKPNPTTDEHASLSRLSDGFQRSLIFFAIQYYQGAEGFGVVQ